MTHIYVALVSPPIFDCTINWQCRFDGTQ